MSDNVALGEEIATIAGRINVATHRLLTCIRRFDEADGWFEQGAQSCAHWLTWRIGLDGGTAREKVRVARALGVLPVIDAAFAVGQLSYAKVRAMTRVATAANEARVLEVALAATGSQLERICRGLRKATAPEFEQAAERRVRVRALGSGLVKLELVVSPDEADLVIQAIERAREQLTPAAQSAADRVRVVGAGVVVAPGALVPAGSAVAARAADATGAAVEVDAGGTPGVRIGPRAGGETRAAVTPSTAVAPRPSGADGLLHLVATFLQTASGAPRDAPAPDAQVIIHLDKDLGAPAGAMAASLDDGTHVSAETLRRVACDGGVVATVVDEQAGVLDVGRRTRVIPTAIKRALWLRDKGCRFPGCANRRFVYGHHVQHWFHGGRTSLDNLVLLCGLHHRLVHEGGFTIALTGGGTNVEVRSPSGALLPEAPSFAPDPGAVECHGTDWWTAGDSFAPPLPSWDGSPIDYDWAIGSLAVAEPGAVHRLS